jgi:uncharacterized protein
MEFISTWILVSGIIFAASFIQGLTGFGFGLVAVPLLLFVLPSQAALTIAMSLAALSALIQGLKAYKQARWDLVIKLLIIGFPGLILGVGFSSRLNSEIIKGIVGVILILYVLWQGARFLKNDKADQSEDKVLNTGFNEPTQISQLKLVFAGFSSGILNGLAAIPGPPIVALLVKSLDKETFKSTTICFFFLQYLITFLAKSILQEDVLDSSKALMILSLILPIFLGLVAGRPIRKRINEENFKKLVYSLLFFIGITSVWEPLKSFFM